MGFSKTSRTLLAIALASAAPSLRAGPASALPEATLVTPDLLEAAKKEGQISFYTSVDVEVAEKMAASFKAKYPGIEVQVERSGSERIFQRIGQEYGSSIYNADVVNTSRGRAATRPALRGDGRRCAGADVRGAGYLTA